jgi:hypothetical protein
MEHVPKNIGKTNPKAFFVKGILVVQFQGNPASLI